LNGLDGKRHREDEPLAMIDELGAMLSPLDLGLMLYGIAV
jgi:hypothetical protein